MRLKLRAVKNKRLLIIAFALALLVGGGITKALLGGTSSPVASSDIELQRGLVGWWKLDGNAKDSTPYGNNGTVTSASLTTDREGAANSAYSFTGTSGQRINLPGTGPYDNFGTNSFSVSSWINTTDTGNQRCVFSTAGASKGFRFGFQGGKPYYLVGDGTTYQEGTVGANSSLDNGSWNHLVIVYTYASNWSVTAYINGVNVGTVSLPAAIGSVNDTIANMGSMTGSGVSGVFAGSIDDVRVYNRALSASEAATLYKEYNTSLNLSSGENSLVGWWKLDGNAKDATPNADNGTLTGTSVTADREGQSARALSFNGSTDAISITDSPILHVTPNLTVSLWVKVDSLTNKTGCCEVVASKEASATNRNFNIYINRTTGNVTGSSSFGGTQFDLNSNTSIFDGKWHLVTYVISGTLQQIYVDGAFKNSHTAAANVDSPSNNIGISPSGGFQGELDDMRMYSRAFSASDIATLFKSYDSQISLYQNSATGVNLGSGLLGEWDFNGNAKDSTPYANNGTVTGATLTADRKGRANSAYALGDSSAWINVGSPSTYSSLSSGLTYNIWLMRTGSSVAHWPEIMGAGNTHIYYGIRSQNFGDSIDFEYATSPYAGSTFSGTSVQSLPVNQWHMFTVTYDGSTLKTYWDSALKTTASSVALNPTFGGLSFTTSTSGFVGSVDDARVWGRALNQSEVTALYTQYR